MFTPANNINQISKNSQSDQASQVMQAYRAGWEVYEITEEEVECFLTSLPTKGCYVIAPVKHLSEKIYPDEMGKVKIYVADTKGLNVFEAAVLKDKSLYYQGKNYWNAYTLLEQQKFAPVNLHTLFQNFSPFYLNSKNEAVFFKLLKQYAKKKDVLLSFSHIFATIPQNKLSVLLEAWEVLGLNLVRTPIAQWDNKINVEISKTKLEMSNLADVKALVPHFDEKANMLHKQAIKLKRKCQEREFIDLILLLSLGYKSEVTPIILLPTEVLALIVSYLTQDLFWRSPENIGDMASLLIKNSRAVLAAKGQPVPLQTSITKKKGNELLTVSIFKTSYVINHQRNILIEDYVSVPYREVKNM